MELVLKGDLDVLRLYLTCNLFSFFSADFALHRLLLTCAYEDFANVLALIFAFYLFHPLSHDFERVLVCHIENKNYAIRTSVIGCRNNAETLLSINVKNIDFHLVGAPSGVKRLSILFKPKSPL